MGMFPLFGTKLLIMIGKDYTCDGRCCTMNVDFLQQNVKCQCFMQILRKEKLRIFLMKFVIVLRKSMQGIVTHPSQKGWTGKLACSTCKYWLMIVLVFRSMILLTDREIFYRRDRMLGVLQSIFASGVLCIFLSSAAYGEHSDFQWHLLKSEGSIDHC